MINQKMNADDVPVMIHLPESLQVPMIFAEGNVADVVAETIRAAHGLEFGYIRRTNGQTVLLNEKLIASSSYEFINGAHRTATATATGE